MRILLFSDGLALPFWIDLLCLAKKLTIRGIVASETLPRMRLDARWIPDPIPCLLASLLVMPPFCDLGAALRISNPFFAAFLTLSGTLREAIAFSPWFCVCLERQGVFFLCLL